MASKKLKCQGLHLIKELRGLCNGNFSMKNRKLEKTLEDEKPFPSRGLADIVRKMTALAKVICRFDSILSKFQLHSLQI